MSLTIICPSCERETCSVSDQWPEEIQIGATCIQCRERLEAEKTLKIAEPRTGEVYDYQEMRFRRAG